MSKRKREPMEKLARKLSRDIAFKLLLIPAVILIILSIVLIVVFSPVGLLGLISWIAAGWIMLGLSFVWFVWTAIVEVFAIEPRAFTGQMRLPWVINFSFTLFIVLLGISIGLSFFQMGRR